MTSHKICVRSLLFAFAKQNEHDACLREEQMQLDWIGTINILITKEEFLLQSQHFGVLNALFVQSLCCLFEEFFWFILTHTNKQQQNLCFFFTTDFAYLTRNCPFAAVLERELFGIFDTHFLANDIDNLGNSQASFAR